MLKYSKAPFWQAIVFSLSVVTFSQISNSVDALPADQDATKQEDLEAQVATSDLDNEDGEDGMNDAYWLDLLSQEDDVEKRAPSPRDLFKANYGKRAPSPRDLFKANYGKRAPNPRDLFKANYGKRAPNPRDLFMNNYGKRAPNPRDLFMNNYGKRAPNPRDLFAAAYGNYGKRAPNIRDLFASAYSKYQKRAPNPRDLFSSVYGNYGFDKRYNNDDEGMINYGESKRFGFKQNDPRSLFRSVYGYLK